MGLLNAVVDLSHHNLVTSFSDAKAAGVIGVIHKATQGTEFSDATYDQHRAAAQAEGLLWGAYHFARRGDVDAQVDHFLSVANIGIGELLVLDFEPNSREGTMTLEEGEEFVTRVAERTGHFPGLYSGQSFLAETVGENTGTPLANCWLWVARYASVQPVVPQAWPSFVLWQYTDGNGGMQPHQVPGIGRCDRDKFDGDEAALRQRWLSGSLMPEQAIPVPAKAPTQRAKRAARAARKSGRKRRA